MTTSRISALTDQPTVVPTDRIPVDAALGTTRSMLVGLLQNHLCNPTGATAPTGDDDVTLGYVFGSIWTQPGVQSWYCGNPNVGESSWTARGLTCLDNLTSGADPSVTDDSSAGYSVGSFWIRSAIPQNWICTDATVGAAVWASVVNPCLWNLIGTGAPVVTDDTTKGYSVGSTWCFVGHASYYCSDATTGAAVWNKADLSLGTSTPASIGTAGAGVSLDMAREDHVHAHGSLAGGAFHADAVASTSAGFLSGVDKAKLDGIASGATATPLSSSTPQAVGTAAAGTGTSASKYDHVHGQVTRDRTTAGNTTLVNTTDDVIRVSAQADLQLPDPAGKRFFVIKKTGTGTYTINMVRYAAEKIEDVAATLALPGSANTDQPAWGFYSDGTNWWVC